jgi:hypothetical protein
VLPPLQREEMMAGEGTDPAEELRQMAGFGPTVTPRRGA